MKKIIFIFIICLFLFSFSAYATVIYETTFPNNNTFVSNGWDYLNGACGASDNENNPVLSPFSSYAFGHISNTSCGTFTREIRRTLPLNISYGVITASFDFSIENDTTQSTADSLVFLLKTTKTSSSYLKFNVVKNSSYISCSGDIKCSSCNLSISLSPPYYSTAYIYIDTNLDFYHVYIDNILYCDNIYFNSSSAIIGFNGMSLLSVIDNREIHTSFIDNLFIEQEAINITQLSDNEPCEIAEDCISGKCENGYCVKKLGKELCDNDIECISQDCVNGKCSKPSASQLFTASKNEQFGNDTDTNNFISLLFSTLVLIIVCLAGRSLIAVMVGGMAFFAVNIFFTIIGWLSVWITFGIFFICLIGAIVLLLLKKE